MTDETHVTNVSVARAEVHEWLTVDEIAATLRVSNMTVHRLIDAGALPAYQFGRSVRIRSADFAAYQESCRMTGGNQNV
ncbi:MAG TPA: helix-turn-helix domain-containing protein [Actinoplanes sp.]|nr:helix-turn-helix domain-containing protein [Actinoplanes sp.]